MLENDKVFAGSIPENYDRFMVPLIFEPYAADIARRPKAIAWDSDCHRTAGQCGTRFAWTDQHVAVIAVTPVGGPNTAGTNRLRRGVRSDGPQRCPRSDRPQRCGRSDRIWMAGKRPASQLIPRGRRTNARWARPAAP